MEAVATVIDTHCHLTSEPLRDRVDEVIAAARGAGVDRMITVSVGSDDCAEAERLAARTDGVWFTAGAHPLHADAPCDWARLRAAARHERCVAWGELGLDNHYETPARALQDRVLAEHLALIESVAQEGLVLPVVVHCREAFDDLLAVLRTTSVDPARFVFHCFTGGPDDARRVLDFGAWISFTGVVTFRNAPAVAAAAKLVPDDRIMVETDAPYLTPEPHRKVWPNEPRYVVDVARRLAALRGARPADLERQLDANATRFFGLDDG